LLTNLFDLAFRDIFIPLAKAQPILTGSPITPRNQFTIDRRLLNPTGGILTSSSNNNNNGRTNLFTPQALTQTTNNNPNVFTPQALIVTTQCTSNQVPITINKQLVDNTNSPSTSSLSFIITFSINDNLIDTSQYQNGDSRQFCVNVNSDWSVVETTPSPINGFTFTTDYTSNPVSTSSTSCSGTAQLSQPITCTVTNTITSGSAPIINPQLPPAESNVNNEQLFSPQALNEGGPTQSGATAAGRQINPPFQVCKANTKTGSTDLNAPNGQPIEDTKTIVRAPSDALYLVKGAIPLDKVNAALTARHTNIITIAVISDLHADDGISTRVDNPQFFGKVIVEDSKDGAKQTVINFNVDAVRTECKFITIGETVGNPPNNVKVTPLGQLKPLTPGSVKASDINKLLVGGPKVTGTLTGLYPIVLNPPFATCQLPPTPNSNAGGKDSGTIAATDANADSFAFYNVKGTIDGDGSISGNRLTVQIITDLVPVDSDLAKIVNQNNQYVKVNLISNENKPDAKTIPFTLKDLTTDCKAISLTSQTVFDPSPGELNP